MYLPSVLVRRVRARVLCSCRKGGIYDNHRIIHHQFRLSTKDRSNSFMPQEVLLEPELMEFAIHPDQCGFVRRDNDEAV